MKRTRKTAGFAAFVLAVALGFAGAEPMAVLAADKTISSVTLRVYSELEPGDTLPTISYQNDGSSDAADGEICVVNTQDRYSITDAEWVTSESKVMEVGMKPEMKVTLTPNSIGDTDYEFKGTYRSSNVTIRNGSFVSASKSSGNLIVKLRVTAIEGTFEAPEDPHWKDGSLGTARWSEPEDGGSGRYEVVLRRGSTKVKTVETTSRSYNFYPYMTRKGTYSFRVRSTAKTNSDKDYGKNSEWAESDEIYLAEEDVSDGRGQEDSITSGGPGSESTSPSPNPTVGNTRVGWQYISGNWYYYYPDGTYHKNGWLKVANRWYLFQNDGRMLTGWQNTNNQTYYLEASGAMAVGWIWYGQNWYYLNPTPDAFEGAMLKSRWMTENGKTYYLTESGAMAQGWKEVDGNWYYFYPGEGRKAVNTWIDTFYVDANGVWRR